MELDLNQLRELVTILNQTDITELSLKSGDLELTLKKGTMVVAQPILTSASAPVTSQTSVPAPEVVSASEPTPPPQTPKKGAEINSPMVGTFYRAPSPDDPPFIDVGDSVKKGQVVCIIEAMKLMNEIEAESNGIVTEILVQNGEPVEFGQALIRINPS
ncbi:acetyl-CoA carboxylase biotin carboxyl carrier protein [Synechococcus sp. PCC 6312]|uniref:acetyl-CoA carboxylase biotin carboxyl carrier protein n=1 Tax=Synechococcus sp. (strain ATCC 27167 / PCC 6312) TaxID=195253 RepID=UPI00029ED7D0|nr:acetyl-CoA carboxylase biotin carboxyl carrier protein [Synechococcus sp. PCC 6312]AFY62445.1 biotin carboxyl carrier protein [Synechococcus sp. PCC 6312]